MNEPIQEGKPIYVFQLPIRIWHWSMVLSFLVLIPTGYIIGKPWHSLDGDPTYLFYMGYTRMAHFIAGFIITIGLLWRIIFAFFGNKYSRQVFIIPFWRKSWWLDLLSDFRWYLFLDRTPREHIGHNPLAQLLHQPAHHHDPDGLRHVRPIVRLGHPPAIPSGGGLHLLDRRQRAGSAQLPPLGYAVPHVLHHHSLVYGHP